MPVILCPNCGRSNNVISEMVYCVGCGRDFPPSAVPTELPADGRTDDQFEAAKETATALRRRPDEPPTEGDEASPTPEQLAAVEKKEATRSHLRWQASGVAAHALYILAAFHALHIVVLTGLFVWLQHNALERGSWTDFEVFAIRTIDRTRYLTGIQGIVFLLFGIWVRFRPLTIAIVSLVLLGLLTILEFGIFLVLPETRCSGVVFIGVHGYGLLRLVKSLVLLDEARQVSTTRNKLADAGGLRPTPAEDHARTVIACPNCGRTNHIARGEHACVNCGRDLPPHADEPTGASQESPDRRTSAARALEDLRTTMQRRATREASQALYLLAALDWLYAGLWLVVFVWFTDAGWSRRNRDIMDDLILGIFTESFLVAGLLGFLFFLCGLLARVLPRVASVVALALLGLATFAEFGAQFLWSGANRGFGEPNDQLFQPVLFVAVTLLFRGYFCIRLCNALFLANEARTLR